MFKMTPVKAFLAPLGPLDKSDFSSHLLVGMKFILLTILLFGCVPLNAADNNARTDSQRIEWWRDARFGLFIHWGPVSLKGTEIGWSRGGERRGYGSTGTEVPVAVYDNLYKKFNPTNYNAEQWVAMAQAAGMKYVVFTSRHHDGFSMFDTKANDYKITSAESPFRRDVVRELADACHKAGMPFGLYYSQPNWQHPDAFTSDRHGQYLAFLKTQVRELLTNYGKVDILWFDGLGKSATDYDAVALNKMIREIQPGILINNRNGLPEDFDTPEQVIGKFQNDRPWESCITICQQWAWKPDDHMKTLQQCLETLVRCAGGDGNLLFNVGPMPDGRIEPRQEARLREMGAWLGAYGQTIYGTRGGPWKPNAAVASTRRGNVIFVHILKWNGETLTLPNIPAKIVGASLLTGGKVDMKQTDEGIVLSVPASDRQPIDTLVKLDLDGSAMSLAPVSLASGIKASASNVYHHMEDFDAEKAFDGDPATRWATDDGTHQAWISTDFGKSRTLHNVVIHEEYEGRVQKFELQYKDANGAKEWRTICSGATLGKNFVKEFSPITAREVRLNILEATDGPTISEIRFE
jgi:alpha-L-fucosidase